MHGGVVLEAISFFENCRFDDLCLFSKKQHDGVPDVMRNQELEKVLEVNTKIEIN